jgi:hypothetical protein
MKNEEDGSVADEWLNVGDFGAKYSRPELPDLLRVASRSLGR